MVRTMRLPFPTSTCLTGPFWLIPSRPLQGGVVLRGLLFVGLPQVSHSAGTKHLPRTHLCLRILWPTGQKGTHLQMLLQAP